MAPSRLDRIQQSLDVLQQRAEADSRIRAEMQRGRREFFGTSPVALADPAASAAERRFREWFLLERPSEVLGAPPQEVLLAADDPQVGDSLVGVFTIEDVGAGSTEAIDIQSGNEHELRHSGVRLLRGDVLVGRLFVEPDGTSLPSPGIAIYRPGAALATAFRRDLERLRIDRRLTQLELERLLIARSAAAAAAAATEPNRPLEHLEAELESLLAQGGCGWSAEDVSRNLAMAPRPGAVMGPLLDAMAFDTRVDLERVRRCLMSVWNAHHPTGPAEPPPAEAPAAAEDQPAGETLGQRLCRTLDEGLARRQDVDQLFSQLEHLAGIDDVEGDEKEGAPVAAGDLAPLVEEYLWERGEAAVEDHDTLRLWVQLQHNAALPRTDLELVTGLDLMRVLLHIYLSAPPDDRSASVRASFAAIQRFHAWAEDTQGFDLGAVVAACRGALLDQLDRLQSAGQQLSTQAAAVVAPQSCMMHVEEVAATGLGVRLDSGDSVWVEVPAPTAQLVHPGDLLLGALERTAGGGRFRGLVVALPPDAETLVG